METKFQEKILKELEDLKKLRVLEFLDNGYSREQLSAVLGTNPFAIGKMVPKRAQKNQNNSTG